MLLQEARRCRKPLLLPVDRQAKTPECKEDIHSACLLNDAFEDDSCSGSFDSEQMPCCQLIDSEKGIVWSPNATYNADLSCFT